MKTRFLAISIFLFCCFTSLLAVDYSNLKDIPLIAKTDYQPQEEKVLECCNYILNSTTPFEKDANKALATAFILRWINGTPDFMFYIENCMMKPVKKDPDLFSALMACMTKYALEHRDKATDKTEMTYNTMLKFTEYCENASFIKKNNEIKKLIKAKNKGELKAYLKL